MDTVEVVQPATPPRTSFDGYSCKKTLLEHNFANSYGAPYSGLYSPPPGDCSFTTTIFNLSVSSRGQQYDRLAQLFIGDVEVWRTSTAMPTEGGIHWSYQKDMSIFDGILRANQKIILDLGNVVDDDLYTGVYNVTLEALYFDDKYSRGFHPADHIYPISNLSSAENKSSVFSLPDDSGSVRLVLPRNIKTAVVSLMASGNGEEEFWYTNVPTEYLSSFDEGSLYGYGSFREVQLLIDDRLAGVSWPFPILFTGGVSPGLWRPIVGIDTYDLPSFEIDVTPWLSLLCDGNEHTFKIQVVGFDNSTAERIGTVGQNWWVTGVVFVWLDEATNQTIAGTVSSSSSPPIFDYASQFGTSVAGNGSVTDEFLWVHLAAQRTLSIASSVNAANGTRDVTWTQNLSFSNTLNVSNAGWDASLEMESTGMYSGSVGTSTSSQYSYPLKLYYSYKLSDTDLEFSSVISTIDRSLSASRVPTLPYLTGTSRGVEELATRQNVSSNYHWNETIVGGIEKLNTCDGETWFSSSGAPASASSVGNYSRFLVEKDGELVMDREDWATMAVPGIV